MSSLEIVLSILATIMIVISIGKYRYENGYSKYSKKEKDGSKNK